MALSSHGVAFRYCRVKPLFCQVVNPADHIPHITYAQVAYIETTEFRTIAGGTPVVDAEDEGSFLTPLHDRVYISGNWIGPVDARWAAMDDHQ